MIDPGSLERIYSSIGQYIDPITGQDLTLQAAIYVANELEKQGITNFSQIESRVIKGTPAKVELGPTEYLFVLPIGEWGSGLFRSGPDGWEYVNANQYEIGQTQSWDSGYTVVEARRENVTPATPDVTKYYNKNTGQEITNRVLLDDKAGTKYTLTDQGLQKDVDPIQRLAVQLRPYVDPSSTGGAWGTKAGRNSPPGFGPEGMMRQIAQRFINLTGLTDLNKLGVRTTTEYHEAGNMVYVPVSVTTYYDKDTGRKIDFYGDLGGWGEGPGITYANILFDDNGKPIIRTYGEDTNTLSDLGPILAIAALVPSPIQPFAIAANALIALDQGDVLGAVASVAGLAGLKEVAAVARVAKAVESGDILGAALAAATASGAGNVQLADGVSVNDVLRVSKAADAISKGDFGTALVLAGQQFGSQELIKAGQGVQLAKAIASGNPTAIANAAGQVMSAYSSDAANAAAKNEGWTGLSEKNIAINFYGPDVTPDQWQQFGQYVDYRTGEAFGSVGELESVVDQFKSITGSEPSAQQIQGFRDVGDGSVVRGFNLSSTTQEEAKAFLEANGYKPTDNEAASFAGFVTESNAKANIAEYVDPRQTTYEEAKAFLGELGYTPTDAEIKKFVGQVNEDAARANIAGYVNPRQITKEEAAAFFKGQNYNPTEEELQKFVTQGANVNESDIKSDVEAFVDPRQVTREEAEAFYKAYGYTPTAAEINQFVGQRDEASTNEAIERFIDPKQVTEAEARAFFEANGYTPTDEEVKQFVGQGENVRELSIKSNIADYVNQRQFSEAEARQVLTDLGVDPESEYGKDLISRYAKQGNQDTLIQQLNNEVVEKYVAPRAQKISDVFDYLNQGKLSPEQAQDELLRFGFTTDQLPAIFAANADAVDRARKAQDIVNDYADIGSDLSREAAVQRLVQEAGVTEAAANNYLSRVDAQVTARNEYQNAVQNYVKGVGDENAVRQAMDAAGLTGDKAESQLIQLRAIREGSELTSSEATNAAVASLDQWQTIDRSGNQIRWARNPEDGTFYVDKARNAQGADITDRFLGATPQSIDKYRVEQQQQYVDRMQKQLTSSAEKYFAPGSKVTADQAIASLKQNDGLTDAMARDVVRQWDQQKEAIAKNNISIDPNTNKTSRILTPEEFEQVLSKANVDISGDKFNQRYQAYLYVNGELLRTGNAKDGFVLPGEVLEVVNKGKNITPLPTNTVIDQIGKTVLEGIKAGQEVGSPAQNFINSLSANFLGLFPRAGAGIVSVVSGDAANDVAVALRGIAKIASDSSDALMPDLAEESKFWMSKINDAPGVASKLGTAWQWASDSPTSFGSLAWTAGKELSEDMLSFALMGKALKTIGTAPGVALGSAITDFALNYGGVTEENISQLINQGLNSEQAAALAGQGAMPAALAETIVGGIAALVPSAKTAIKDLILLPYKATVDGVEEAASYVFNQKGLGQSIDLNDFWTSGVIAATVGGTGHGGASVSVFLSPQGQGQAIKDANDLGVTITQDPFLIPESARATITSVINNTAVISGPNGQTYVSDLGNQNILPGQQVNIYSLDTTPVKITPQEMTDYLGLVDEAYQTQLGRQPTSDEINTAIKDLSGVGQLQEQLDATQEGQRYDQIVDVFDETLGRKPTSAEVKANIQRLSNNEITAEQLAIELKGTNEGVLFQQKTDFNAQTDQQIAANAKSLLDQGRTTYAEFKDFMNTMGLASDRQLNVLDTITPRANVAGTVTSIIGDNAVVTGTDGQMYTMLRVAPNNYLIQVGDQVKLGVSTVKPDATPTVEVTTKIADVIAASVSKSTSISLSQSVSEAAVSTSISKSQSLSVSYSQSQSLSASTSVSVSESQSKSISLSQSVSTVELEKSISLSKSVSTSLSTSASLSTSTSLSQSVSASTSTSQSLSASISKAVSISEALSLSASVSEQMEMNRLKGLSISASLSESISQAVSVSESISKAVSISESTSASISTSQSISQATSISQSLSASTSQSESVSKATSISASVSASTSASLSASTSQSISLSQEVSKQVSISQSTSQSIALSQSLSQSQAVSVSASVSESVSKSASASLSLSQSTSAALSTSVSQSLSLSQKMSEDVVRGLSISASLSASESVSQSVSRLVSASISTSQSTSTSLSLSESISKATQLSISNSLSASASVSQSQSLSASQSVSKALSQSVSQSLSLSESVAQSISQSLSLSAFQSQSLSVSEQIERDRAVGISISNSLSQSVSLEASKSQSISISTSTQQSISNAVSLSESVSISTYLSQEVSRQTSLSQSLSTANSLSLSLSQSQSLSQSLSQAQTVSITPSITQTVSVTETIAPTATVAPSVTESITQTVTQSVTESITEVITQSLTEALTPSLTATITQLPTLAPTITASATIAPSISVTETFTQTPSLTMVITTTSLPPVTTTITIPPVTTSELVTTEQVTTITIPPVTPPPTSGTIPPVTTPSISVPDQTTTAPITTLPVTTAPITTAVTTARPPTTTARPPTTTARPGGLPFPIFGIPAATGQQTTYIDYAQPKVPAPEFGPYDLFKAPSYLRPLQDSGNFGLAALIGAASESQQRNGDNQSQQNAESQGQAPKG